VGQDASLAERHVSESQAKAPPSRYRLFRPDNPATALEMAVNHLMWSRLLVGQINRGRYRFVLDGKNRAVFFYWLVGEASGEAWLSGRVGVQNDDCIVFNAWSSNRAGVNRFVLVAVRRDARLPAGLLHALLQGRRDQAIAHERQ